MSGVDGCERFLFYKIFVEEMDKVAEEGDEPAKHIIEMVTRFSNLINVAQDLQKSHKNTKKS